METTLILKSSVLPASGWFISARIGPLPMDKPTGGNYFFELFFLSDSDSANMSSCHCSNGRNLRTRFLLAVFIV